MSDIPNPVVESWLPLKPVWLHVLLALAEQDSHAYGVIQAVRDGSSGRINLETGPLYRYLRKMLDGGLIKESGTRPPGDDPRRGAYYTLTQLGHDVVFAESRRLEELVSHTKKLGLMARGGTA